MSRIPLTNVGPAPKVESRKPKVEPEKVAKPLESAKVETGLPHKVSDSQREASKRYSAKNAQVAIRIPPEMKEKWDEYANGHHISLRALIINTMNQRIEE